MVYLILLFIAIFLCVPLCVSLFKQLARKKINEQIREQLINNDFNITKTFFIEDSISGDNDKYKQLVFIDEKSQKIAFVDYLKKVPVIVSLSDVINCKLVNDFETSITGKYKEGIIKDSYQEQTQTKCKTLKIIVRINDITKPQIVYTIIDSIMPISIDSKTYKRIYFSAEEVISLIDVLGNTRNSDEGFIYCQFCGTKNKKKDVKCYQCGSNLK